MPGSPLPSRTWRALIALVVLVVVTGGCSSAGVTGDAGSVGSKAGDKPSKPKASAARTTPTRAPAPAPDTNTCRDLTYGDISRFSNAAPGHGCEKPHTGFTFSVAKLPKDVAFEGVDIGNDAVQEEAALLCRAEFAPYIGGNAATRALSRLSVTYFLPSQADFDLGARWVRCDVIALQSARILAELPKPVQGFNDADGALDEYGVCSRGEPGTTSSMLVMCNQDHTFRALTALRLGADDTSYPGDAVVRDDGQQRCDDFVSAELDLGGGYSYAWTYPSSEDWDNGQRFGFCWTKSAA